MNSHNYKIVYFIVLLFFPIVSYSLVKDPENDPPDTSGNNIYTKLLPSLEYKYNYEYTDDAPQEIVNTMPWSKYDKGSTSALAVYITNPNCNWLPLVHALKTGGIPFIVTSDFNSAAQHNVILAYPELSPQFVNLNIFFNLRSYIINGGTIVAAQPKGLSIKEVFGYVDIDYDSKADYILFKKNHFKYDQFRYKREKRMILSNPKSQIMSVGNVKYLGPTAKRIANFNDGNAAILENNFGKGKAIAIGIDLDRYFNIAYSGKQTDLARSYVNQFEPGIDVMIRLIREYYREAGGITLGTCPDGKHLNIIITHDIDFTKSVRNAFDYALFEKSMNIHATYFMQTKYIEDWSDKIFFTDENVRILNEIKLMNMEIASHSVCHARTFKNFNLGNNLETYQTYAPFNQNALTTTGGTIYGELRVSKQLLDSSLKINITSFRPGHLSYPVSLPQSLNETGYKYSSSITANDALTHLPFQLDVNRDGQNETPVYEFPITIEDEEGIMLNRLSEYKHLANQISKEDGMVVVLIHPNILGQKLEFEKRFIEPHINKANFMSIREFGDWWSVRNDVEVEYDNNKIKLKSAKGIEGLTLLLPNKKTIVIPYLKDSLEINFKNKEMKSIKTSLFN